MDLGNALLPPFVLPPANSGAGSCGLPSYPSSLGERRRVDTPAGVVEARQPVLGLINCGEINEHNFILETISQPIIKWGSFSGSAPP